MRGDTMADKLEPIRVEIVTSMLLELAVRYALDRANASGHPAVFKFNGHDYTVGAGEDEDFAVGRARAQWRSIHYADMVAGEVEKMAGLYSDDGPPGAIDLLSPRGVVRFTWRDVDMLRAECKIGGCPDEPKLPTCFSCSVASRIAAFLPERPQ
jgi:hypothetical protein